MANGSPKPSRRMVSSIMSNAGALDTALSSPFKSSVGFGLRPEPGPSPSTFPALQFNVVCLASAVWKCIRTQTCLQASPHGASSPRCVSLRLASRQAGKQKEPNSVWAQQYVANTECAFNQPRSPRPSAPQQLPITARAEGAGAATAGGVAGDTLRSTGRRSSLGSEASTGALKIQRRRVGVKSKPTSPRTSRETRAVTTSLLPPPPTSLMDLPHGKREKAVVCQTGGTCGLPEQRLAARRAPARERLKPLEARHVVISFSCGVRLLHGLIIGRWRYGDAADRGGRARAPCDTRATGARQLVVAAQAAVLLLGETEGELRRRRWEVGREEWAIV